MCEMWEARHEGASCSHQELCINCKGKHAASSRECPKWKLENRVQQLKVERGTTQAQQHNTATTQRSQKSTISIAIQTELTWPQGTDTPVPVKTNSQTTQTDSNENSAKNTEIPPLLLLHQEVTDVQMLQYHPTAVCIQETLLHSNKTASLQNYLYYGIPAVENNSSLHGGVAILIKNSTPHQQLHINTGLQAIVVRATCHKTITICSIYRPSRTFRIFY